MNTTLHIAYLSIITVLTAVIIIQHKSVNEWHKVHLEWLNIEKRWKEIHNRQSKVMADTHERLDRLLSKNGQ